MCFADDTGGTRSRTLQCTTRGDDTGHRSITARGSKLRPDRCGLPERMRALDVNKAYYISPLISYWGILIFIGLKSLIDGQWAIPFVGWAAGVGFGALMTLLMWLYYRKRGDKNP
jgi:hypothetical protein